MDNILLLIAAPIIAWFIWCALHMWLYPEEAEEAAREREAKYDLNNKDNPKKSKRGLA